MAVHVATSWHRYVVLGIAVAGLLVGCASAETDGDTTDSLSPDVISGEIAPRSADEIGELSSGEAVVPIDTSPPDEPSEEAPTTSIEVAEPSPGLATAAPGLEAHFDRREDDGDEVIDPCGLIANGRPSVAEPPPAFFGQSRSYGDDEVEYRQGATGSWCVYDFEVGAPITVTIIAPDGSQVVNEVVLDGGSPGCPFGCPLDQSLIAAGPTFNVEALVAEAKVGDRVDGIVGSWIPAQAPLGRYRVRARQTSPTTGEEIASRSHFRVVAPDVAGVSVASSRTVPGSPEVGYVVGHEPNATVRLGLYVGEPAECEPPDCESPSDAGTRWHFVEMLGDVGVDTRGAATVDLDPMRWGVGPYCVVSPSTFPGADTSSGGADPCFHLNEFPATFDRDWTAADSRPSQQVVVSGPTIGVDLSPRGTRVVSTDAGAMTVRDVDGSVVTSVPRDGVEYPEFAGSGDRIVSTGPDGVEVWDLASGTREIVVPGEVFSPVLVEGGDALIGHQNDAIRRWDLATGESEVVLNFGQILGVDVNDDVTGIVVATSANVYSWDFQSADLLRVTSPGMPQLEVNSRGDEVLMIVEGVVTIRGMDGAVLLTLPAEGVEMARLSSDGDSIATVGADGVKIWNREGGSIGQIPRVGIEQISHIEFGPEPDTLLIADDHGVVLHQV